MPGRRNGRGAKAAAVAALLAAAVAGCGGSDGGTVTTVVRTVVEEPASTTTATTPTATTPTTTTPGAATRQLAGSFADQERALAVLLSADDLPGDWEAEGRAVSGLSAAPPTAVGPDGRAGGADLLGIRCLEGDRRSRVAALARAPVFTHSGGKLDNNVIVYVDDAAPAGTLDFLRRAAFRDCFAETITDALRAGFATEIASGDAQVGNARAELVDGPDAGVGSTALRFEVDVEAQGERGRIVTDVVAFGEGPALSFLQVSWLEESDEELLGELAGRIGQRLQAVYG